jgi:histidine triad (HIT) family protein
MYNHTHRDYKCPICLGIKGIENKDTLIKKSDIVFRNRLVTVFVASFFIGKNLGHAIIVPNKHHENLYDLPNLVGKEIFALSKKVALVMKNAYGCDGITILQNNEPAGDQHAFHYHLHVFPRYKNDNFSKNLTNKKLASQKVRKVFAEKLKKSLATKKN